MKNLSIEGMMIAVLPPLAVLALFYSLATHMYLSLGHWPGSIGYRGFSRALVIHCETQFWCVMAVSVVSICLWPLAIVLSALIPGARRYLPYLGLYALAVIVCWGLMQLAPERFMNWWWD